MKEMYTEQWNAQGFKLPVVFTLKNVNYIKIKQKTYKFIVISCQDLCDADTLWVSCIDVGCVGCLCEYWSVLVSSYIDVNLCFTLEIWSSSVIG